MSNKKIGNYRIKKRCRFCESKNLIKILDFGSVPLAGAFIRKKDFLDEKFYPLEIFQCQDCFLVQVCNVISVDILFKEKYFFFSSAIGTLIDHFKDFAEEIFTKYLNGIKKPVTLEIGSNDGVLIKPLTSYGVFAIGVDPATNVINSTNFDNSKIYNDCFTEKIVVDVKEKYGKVDAVLACYSFAHIDNMIEVLRGIDLILKKEGVFIFELYYLGTLIDEMQYDNFYHEHMSYYSIESLRIFLKRFGMEIFDTKYFSKVRSGATRFYVKYINNKNLEISPRFKKLDMQEKNKEFNNLHVLSKYAVKVKNTKVQLMNLLEELVANGKTIIGYGASGRGTTIMNYCGIDSEYLDYVVDDAPAKHGFFTPGTHLPIKPWSYINKAGSPDYIILFAWAFLDEVITKRKEYILQGGKFIIPLPEVRVVGKEVFNKN